MDYYCAKCLVNKVKCNGDVCSACGGGSIAEDNYEFDNDFDENSYSDDDYTTGSNRYVRQDNTNHDRGGVVVRSRRRVRGASGDQSSNNTAPQNSFQQSYSNQPTNNNSLPNTQTSPKQKKITSCSGVIQNFTSGPDERTFLTRIIESLFLGISYNGKNNLFMTEFQLYENWNSGYGTGSSSPQATRVVYYGKVAQGRPVENNDVTVHGYYDTKNNYLVAESIINQTDGTSANFVPRKIPAIVIRIIVVGILLAILSAVFFGMFGGGGGSADPSGGGVGLTQILCGLLGIGIGVVIIALSRSARRGSKVAMIGVGGLMILMGLSVMTISNFGEKVSVFARSVISIIIMALVIRLLISFALSGIGHISNPLIDKLLNWLTIIFTVLTIGSTALGIFFG